MSLRHGLLGLLNYGAMTGYELSAAFEDSLSFFWQAKSSQIYRELNSMEKAGWLTSEHIIQTDKPNKRLYSITDEGRAELQNWLANPSDDIKEAMRVRSAFLMRVFFAGETTDQQALNLLKDFLQECLKTVETLGAASEAISKYGSMVDDAEKKAKFWKLTAMFGEDYYRAEINWAQKAIGMMEDKINENPGN